MSGKLNLDFLAQMINEERKNFKKKEPPHQEEEKLEEVSFSTLLETIEEVREGFNLLGEEKSVIKELAVQATTLEDWLPTIQIVETSWGQPGKGDRRVLDMFMTNLDNAGITGERTLEGRIMGLQNFISSTTKTDCPATIPKIFARIVVLDLFSTVLKEFTQSAGGFILEALFAALAGKRGKQITEAEGAGGGGKPIVDFVGHNGMPYSLKLLRSTGTIEGSIYNLLNHLATDPKGMVRYVCAFRDKGEKQITFQRFEITKDNIGKFLLASRQERDHEAFIQGLIDPRVVAQAFPDEFEYGPADLSEAKQIPDLKEIFADMSAKTLFRIYANPGKDFKPHHTQFELSRSQAAKWADSYGGVKGDGSGGVFAAITSEEGALKEAAERCAAQLREQLVPIYAALKGLTDSFNQYFLAKGGKEGEGQRHTAAGNAIDIIDNKLPGAIDASGVRGIK